MEGFLLIFMASEHWITKLYGFTDGYKNRSNNTVTLSAAYFKQFEILYNK